MKPLLAGDRFGFSRPDSNQVLPDAWRDLDRAIWRWMLAHGADDTTAELAAWVSHAEGLGHSALPLTELVTKETTLPDKTLLATLRASDLVHAEGSDKATPRPLVLEGGHLYLHRHHHAECIVANALRTRQAQASTPRCPLSDEDLRALFNGSWSEAEERQRAAVQQAVGKRLMVLTGGPGTGKTTTVLRMLLGLSREHHALTGYLPHLNIAAPTGKAAQRLSESLRNGAQRLTSVALPLSEAWQPHLSTVLAAESSTVHRLLGSRGHQGGFRYHANDSLPSDIVVVDEASMLDLGLLRALLEALREDSVLILVGDADQLTSVGTGSIMMDIVQALENETRGDLIRLSHCFRADTTLIPINEAVRTGNKDGFQSALDQAAAHTAPNGRPSARSLTITSPQALHKPLSHWAKALQHHLAEVRITEPAAPDSAELATRLAVMQRQQLLCALREGPFGAVQVAATVAAHLRRWEELTPWVGNNWYPGRAVIITRNDHAARLYNGDVGLCVRVEQPDGDPLLQVAFDPAPETAHSNNTAAPVRLFAPNTLPAHEDAFALTVHKSQGSEYDHVAVLLPPDSQSPLLARQTLYTGLSRARQSIELWSNPNATDRALDNVLQRFGLLKERIVCSGGVSPR